MHYNIFLIFWYVSDIPWTNTDHLQKELGSLVLFFRPGSDYTNRHQTKHII